jgi:hypothetical protein
MGDCLIYETDWRVLRKLHVEFGFIGLLLLGALALWVWAGLRFEIIFYPLTLILAWLWFSTIRRILRWPCPRCGRPFHDGDFASYFPKKRCGHCDLGVGT